VSSSVSALSYTYDAANRLLSETQDLNAPVNFPPKDRNQVKDIIVVGPPPPISYTYDTAGNRVGRSLENGTITAYSYDDAGRLASLEHKIGGVSLQRFDYTLNAQGSRTARVESNNSVAQTDVYTYDPSEQITQVKYNYNAGTGTQDREVNYAYDAVGNRTAVTDNGTPTPYTANSLNQYMAIDAFAAPACDGNGNLTTLQSAVGAPVWTYNYDAQNRLTGGVSTSGDTFTFAYDPRNRCVVRTVGGTATCYLYDDWNVIEDRSAADLQVAQYYQGAAVDEVIAAVNPNGTFFHHHDGLGSVTAVTDATGAIAERVRGFRQPARGIQPHRESVPLYRSRTSSCWRWVHHLRLSQSGLFSVDRKVRPARPTRV